MNTVDGLSTSRRISVVAKNESCATQSALETVKEAQILSCVNGIFWNACFSSFAKRNREPAGKPVTRDSPTKPLTTLQLSDTTAGKHFKPLMDMR
jgi:hypothetical protein